MIKYTIYKTTNLLTLQFYIGVHKTKNENDSYLGSGIYLTRSIKKYGRQHFNKEILYTFTLENDAYEKEIELVESFKNDPLCLNIGPGGIGGAKFNKKHSEETKNKVSKAIKGCVSINKNDIEKRIQKDQLEQYLNDGWYVGRAPHNIKTGRKFSLETRKKLSEAASKQKRRKKDISEKKIKRKNLYETEEERRIARSNTLKEYFSKNKFIYVNDGSKNKRIRPEELNEYLEKGWQKGHWNTVVPWNKGKN